MREFLLGSSYYPEWWDEKDWEEDFALMEKSGFNAVRMGEFAWSWFEPEEGKYNFEPMRRAVECAARHNIKVIMGTVSAVCPPWLYKKYPGVKGANEKGAYTFGGRKGQCLSSKIFLEYVRKITKAQLIALGSHENIIGWQTDNEPGYPFSDYSPLCNAEFRLWLKDKYKTTENLNKAWFSMMWSNYYSDFDEIYIPVNASESGWTPEIQLDYRKFFSFTFSRLLSMEADIIRKYSPGRFIYTNWPGANWSVNCFEGEKYLDYAAWDNYVEQPSGENYRSQLKASMEHSFDRRLSGGKNAFLVAEQPGFTDADTCPEVIRAQTWWNVAHGAFATVFFQWRTPAGGAEQAYESVTGRDRKVRPETEGVFKELSEELERTYKLIDGAKTEASAAFIYSYENSWGTEGWTVDGFYDTEIFNSYGGFKNILNTDIDIISADDDFSPYKIIVMPNLKIVSEAQAERIKKWVENGGIAVMNTGCGTRDESNKTRLMKEPGLFADLCGAYVEGRAYAGDIKKHRGTYPCVKFGEAESRQVSCRINILKTVSAEPVAYYSGGLISGKTAAAINKYGKGYALLYGTDGNDVYFYESLAGFIKEKFSVKSLIDADEGILAASRTKDGIKYIFAVNMKERPGKLRLDALYFDEIKERELSGEITLEPYGVLMLKKL